MTKTVAELEAELAAARDVEAAAAQAERAKALAVADLEARIRAKVAEIGERDAHVAELMRRADEATASGVAARDELAALKTELAALQG